MEDSSGVARRYLIEWDVCGNIPYALLGKPWMNKEGPRIATRSDEWYHAVSEKSLKLVTTKKELRQAMRDSAGAMILQGPTPTPIRHLVRTEPELVQNQFKPDSEPVQDHFSTDIFDLEKLGIPETSDIPEAYRDFADVFSPKMAAVQAEHSASRDHAIEIEEGKEPPWGPIYALSPHELEVLREYIDGALAKGWIRHSNSSAAAPILFVPKKGGEGKLRLCVDYRALNKITKKDRTPIPLISEILDRLQGAKTFTKLDLTDAYHRIRIRSGDEWKTAFRTRYGLFEYLVLPFGLVNAPATFQKYINKALGDLVDVICIVYLDDILIYSKNAAEHTRHVRQVLEKLRAAELFVNLKKCEFSTSSVSFLGFVVGEDGIEMEQDRVAAIRD